MRTLLFATTSEGKLREARIALQDLPFRLCSIKDLENLPAGFDVPEPGKTFEGNAIIKAMTLGKRTGLLTLSEDAGLMVDALQGAPGVYSKRFAPGTDEDRNQAILKALEGIPLSQRTAQFYAVMALYDPSDDRIFLCEGRSTGHITLAPEGTEGFGYDPIFYCDALQKTNAMATVAEKNTVSHRGAAFEAIRKILQNSFN